jgi:alcohol dehydrogenase (cytochrome c)
LFVAVAAMPGSPPYSQAEHDPGQDAAARSAYAVECSGCHGAGLEGGQFGPPLEGARFWSRWNNKAAELLDYVSQRMPPNGSGSLSESEYAGLVAMILTANGVANPGVAQEPAAPVVSGDASADRPVSDPFEDVIYAREMAARQKRLAQISPVTAQLLRAPPPGDWLSWRRTQDASGFSPLRQIDGSSIAGLRLKWAWSLKPGRNEIAPIVHDGVMFLNSASDIEALDAANGALLWRYRREIAPQFRGPLNMVQRSLAIFGRDLYAATADRHVVALDVGTGRVLWDLEVVAPSESAGAILSAGPLVADGVLVQGVSLGPACPGGCYVVGIDAHTGTKLWRFDTIAKAGPASDSWNGAPSEARSGAAVWTTPSYDPELGAVYVGTGNTYDIGLLLKPNLAAVGQGADALFTNSTLALEPKTGKLLWYHQHFAREVWDLDEVFERTLVTLPVDGQPRRLTVSVGKVGILDALDRRDGRYAFSIDLGLNNLVTSIDPRSGRRTVNSAKLPSSSRAVEVCPSVQGVRNWMASAYDPRTHVLYLPLQDVCMDFNWNDTAAAAQARMGMAFTMKPRPGSDGRYGVLEAVDLLTRKPLWIRRTREVPMSSLLATAGGLLFGGSSDRSFRAYDARTGKVLWETRLNAPPNATPVTFSIAGKQYVAIVSGGGGSHEAASEGLTPELAPPASSTTVWVFGL